MTISIIAANTLIFILQIALPAHSERVTFSYGAIPHFLMTLQTVQPLHPLLTIVTSMFMHGGLLHLFTNMLYLWIFGNNIEDVLGHGKFIFFYLLCGFAAAYSHALTDTHSMVPMIGASGAVSGVLGAYLLLFPFARVHTLIVLIIFIQVIRLPAIIVIGFWIVIQFVNGLASKGMGLQSGVAWFAHIGGFLFGFIMIMLMIKRKETY